MDSFATQPDVAAATVATGSMVAAPAPEIIVTDQLVDSDWDAFVASTPGGHHVQTSRWARLKASCGWNCVRLVAKDAGQVVGGCQILIRSFGSRLKIGYVAKGPLLSTARPPIVAACLRAFHEQVRAQNLFCTIVQPALTTASTSNLQSSGFHPVRLSALLQATTVIDLSQSLDDILSKMRPKTRKSVRQSQQRGIQVRRGSHEDLDTFYDLFTATSDRQGFQDYSKSYLQQLWRMFEPGGHIELFLAEKDAKPVAAALRIAFGDTVLCKKRGWSGEFGNLRPNEAVEWAAIQWAKQAGYRYYDFEGLPRRIAEVVLRGEPLPEENTLSPARYKLGYGGDVRILPESLAFFSNPVVRWGHRVVYPRIADWPVIDRLIHQIKVN